MANFKTISMFVVWRTRCSLVGARTQSLYFFVDSLQRALKSYLFPRLSFLNHEFRFRFCKGKMSIYSESNIIQLVLINEVELARLMKEKFVG